MLYCMYNDLVGEFEGSLTAKNMRGKLKIRFIQTSATGLHTLHLKWVQYKIDTILTMDEHLRTMSAIVWDIKPRGREISEEEQVPNVTRALPEEPEH